MTATQNRMETGTLNPNQRYPETNAYAEQLASVAADMSKPSGAIVIVAAMTNTVLIAIARRILTTLLPEANFVGYRDELNTITSNIMDIPDFDINGVVENKEIYYEDIKTPEIPEPELPPPPAAGKFSTVITVDGFEYQYDIQFNHDGTAFIGGGIPFSENDETYNGTYTLLEDEEPNTYRFNVNGGFIYDITEGPSDPQDYELVIRVTPIPNSEEYTVTILSESAPLFYTHDLPNFTFIPYE